MICYMPFTCIGEHELKMLTQALGTLTVYSPADSLVPAHMRHWEQRGELNIGCSKGVNADQLVAVLRQHKNWADLHQGAFGDIAGYVKYRQGRFAMTDDTDPTQIGDQIRHYGEEEEGENESAGSLFKTALFLSMAQEYDVHHHSVLSDLDAIHAMEREMMTQLSGDRQEHGVTLPIEPTIPATTVEQAKEPYMISQRVQAWSRLALDIGASPLLYLTPSKTVVAHIAELFPDSVDFLKPVFITPLKRPIITPSRIQEIIHALANPSDSQQIFEPPPDLKHSSLAKEAQLIIYRLADVSPLVLLVRLAALKSEDMLADLHVEGADHTLIGLVTTT